MIRAIFSKLSLPVLLALAPLPLSGCSEETHPPAEATADTGTLSMPLVTSANGHTYRLTGYLYVSGPTYRYLSTSDETELSAALPTGDYWASLYSYGLQRLDDTGNYQSVEATLVSSNGQPFTIYNQASTTISFQFETDGLIVTVGSGNLDLEVDVTETGPLCMPLEDDCAEGTWCAPPELTGKRLACIATGSVASGEPCASPLECAANTTCYDFGGGPVCAWLCSATFGAACPDGDTCAPVGSTYGVCAPDGQTLPGGGGEGGAESGGNGSAGGEG